MLTQYREKLHLKDAINYQRQKKRGKFTGLKAVCILIYATDKSIIDTALSYSKDLGKRAGKITILGYVDVKELSGEYPFMRFCKKDLDWLWRPKKEVASHFKQQKFDLLINLSQTDCLPLEHLAVAIDANYKIGALTDYPNNYDLMLDFKNLDKYLDQINFFIEKFSDS